MTSRVLLVGLLLLNAWVSPARADRDKARAHFQRGTSYYNLSRFEDALKEYETAYLEHPDPVFLFNIGQCYRQLGQHDLAIRSYRNYLRTADNPPNRADVEDKIKELEAMVARGGGKPPGVEAAAGASSGKAAPPRGPAERGPSQPPAAVAPPAVAQVPAPADPVASPPPFVAPPVPDPALSATPAQQSADEERDRGGPGWLLWAGVGAGVVAVAALVIILSSGGAERPPCPEGIRCY